MTVQAAPQPRPVPVQAGDRARKNLDHHPDHILAASMTSGTRPSPRLPQLMTRQTPDNAK